MVVSAHGRHTNLFPYRWVQFVAREKATVSPFPLFSEFRGTDTVFLVFCVDICPLILVAFQPKCVLKD